MGHPPHRHDDSCCTPIHSDSSLAGLTRRRVFFAFVPARSFHGVSHNPRVVRPQEDGPPSHAFWTCLPAGIYSRLSSNGPIGASAIECRKGPLHRHFRQSPLRFLSSRAYACEGVWGQNWGQRIRCPQDGRDREEAIGLQERCRQFVVLCWQSSRKLPTWQLTGCPDPR